MPSSLHGSAASRGGLLQERSALTTLISEPAASRCRHTPVRGCHRLRHRLIRAIAADELVVHYQPQMDLRTRQLNGLEALVRWQHPQLGLLPPARFIPLAEETDLIVALDRWVLRTVCRQNRAWQQAGLAPVRVSVNLSGRHLGQSDLVETVAQVLAETQLAPHYLGLEITETHALQEIDATVATLRRLRSLGVQLALDDFGCGYASLSYLKYFPVQALKIDRSFIQQLPGDPTDAAITTAIVNLGHQLDRQVVAEGVENEEQLRFLQAVHCDAIQGYHFSRPLPAGELPALLRQE
jgi:EAL domain-containing protein (putative c-di-GMP-specific phosphodiesterase class I)